MTASAQSFTGGFSAPVFDSQATFRAVLDALARPGMIVPLAARTHPPKPLPPLAADILCALADQDTPVLFSAAPGGSTVVADWLRFQTGAPVTNDAGAASFAVAADLKHLPALSQFPQGTPEYPDRSTTIIVPLSSLTGGDPVTLSGPGIKGTRTFAPKGLSAGFWEQAAANHAQYPRGVDLIFVSAIAIAALPRSTTIGKGEA
ncbi:phosphonate C-P lyase system protein PhnH [Breoghania sp. L-A4]|uniref:phosphonate C-P lyase system protein PhnH n=1 Tax=Breoghania sp. L-A4 TaxID=2304600 RepID=UPI000E358B56|nr:phosphonate C-P lyase system protein PhnH [Breoghania sp. L-A4]AXS39159.1 phosphonate C-P lyase system protein PhnH [Breoghania sp. L-A4]